MMQAGAAHGCIRPPPTPAALPLAVLFALSFAQHHASMHLVFTLGMIIVLIHPCTFPPPMAAPAEEEALRLQSASTLDCCRRADLTAALIAKLGIKTADVEQQRPDTIESVQEEAPSAAEAGTQ